MKKKSKKKNYPLDRLIRFKCSDEKRINFKKEKVIHILERTGRIIAYQGILSKFRKIKSYVINRENTAEHETECIVNDVSNDYKIILIIKYKIRCLKSLPAQNNHSDGKIWKHLAKEIKTTLLSFHINIEESNEDKIVRALYKEEDPAASLHKLIERWIREYRKESGDKAFILNFFELRKDLSKVLSEKAAEEVGVSFVPRIKLEYEDDWDPIQIESETPPIMLKGADDEITFKFKTELYRNLEPDRYIYALARRHRLMKIEKWMPGRIATFLTDTCVLQQIFFVPKNQLRAKIIDHLNATLLKNEGRHMSSMALTIDFDFEFPTPFITEDFKVEINVEGERNKIEIIYRLVMAIEDLDRFRVFKLPDFRAWLTARLAYVTNTVFHSKTYTELMIEFSSRLPELEEELKEKIKRFPTLVGYSLQEVNLITNFEGLRYKEGYRFAIAIENTSFATGNNLIKVILDIVVSGSIKNMQRFKEDVSWKFQNEIESAVKEYLLAKLKGSIKKMTPERFFSHIFDYERPEGGLGEVKQLKDEIAAILQSWDTSNITINLKLLESDAATRIKALRRGALPFDVTAFPYKAKGYGERIIIDGKFIIAGISEAYWGVFTSRRYKNPDDEIEVITGFLSDCIRKEVNIISTKKLYSINREELPEIEKIVADSIKKVEEAFGLSIRIIHFNRRPVVSEEIAFKQQQFISKVSVLVEGVKRNLFSGKKNDHYNK